METIEQTTLRLRPQAEKFINQTYGATSDEAWSFWCQWNDQYGTWKTRHDLVMHWLQRQRITARNGGGR